MISSLASVLVANANATPENVVPYVHCQSCPPRCRVKATHEIDSDNELSFASRIVTLHFGWPAIIRVRALYRLWPVAIWLMSLWRLPHGISGWRRLGVELLLVLRSVRMPSAGVDRWRRHRTRRPALIRMPWSSQCPSLVGVLV